MATSRQKKEEILRDLNDKLSRYKAAVFVDYSGINVKKLEDMRNELGKEGGELKVAKKTLLNIALKKSGIEAGVKDLPGQVGVAFGFKDEVAPAKIIYKFKKDVENLKIIAGLLGKEFISADRVEILAKLPSYEDLLAKMVGSMQAPISGFVNVLAGNIRGLVQVLSAISQKA